ncbi:unnamed protein product [Prunus armeniaca]
MAQKKKIQNLLIWCLSSVEGNDEVVLSWSFYGLANNKVENVSTIFVCRIPRNSTLSTATLELCYLCIPYVPFELYLQRINEIQLVKLRSEFRSGLDALTMFVFERTRPKQVGATMMMGPAPYPLHGRILVSNRKKVEVVNM